MSSEDDQVRIRVASALASAGVGYNTISAEINYLLPKEFMDRYTELFEKALGMVGTGQREGGGVGSQMQRTAALGKAETKTADKGKKVGAGAGAGGKRFKKIFVIQDENALRLKSQVDKKLRDLARLMRSELSEVEARGGRVKSLTKCSLCGKIMADDWKCCPYDGVTIERERA